MPPSLAPLKTFSREPTENICSLQPPAGFGRPVSFSLAEKTPGDGLIPEKGLPYGRRFFRSRDHVHAA